MCLLLSLFPGLANRGGVHRQRKIYISALRASPTTVPLLYYVCFCYQDGLRNDTTHTTRALSHQILWKRGTPPYGPKEPEPFPAKLPRAFMCMCSLQGPRLIMWPELMQTNIQTGLKRWTKTKGSGFRFNLCIKNNKLNNQYLSPPRGRRAILIYACGPAVPGQVTVLGSPVPP